jgi:hypothetical protein
MTNNQQPASAPLPAGIYRAQVVSIVVDERNETPERTRTGIRAVRVNWAPKLERKYTRRPKSAARFPPQYIWTFDVSSSDGDIFTLTGHSSQKSGDNAKATRWEEAIMNRPRRSRERLNRENLVGCWCKVTVITEDGRNKIKDVTRRDWQVV